MKEKFREKRKITSLIEEKKQTIIPLRVYIKLKGNSSEILNNTMVEYSLLDKINC